MPEMLVNLMFVLVAFLAMEWVAWFSHKYVMHGFMWCWHESHHKPRQGVFEKNDLFAVMFALPSIACIYWGNRGMPALLYIGIGIALYGLMYFIFHDVIVHRRIRTGYVPRSSYMRRIVEAHWVHHSTQGKDDAVSFGFLYSPPIDQLLKERDRLQGRVRAA